MMKNKSKLKTYCHSIAIVVFIALYGSTNLRAQENETQLTNPAIATHLEQEKAAIINNNESSSVPTIKYENLNAEYANADYLMYQQVKTFVNKNKSLDIAGEPKEDISAIVTIKGKAYQRIGTLRLIKKEITDINISDLQFTDVTILTLEDSFSLTEVNNVKSKYDYRNTYVEVYSENGSHIATVKYIRYSIGTLSSEYKSTNINPDFDYSLNKRIANSVQITPNPASGYAKLNFEIFADDAIDVSAGIYDVTGKLMRSILNEKKLDAGSYSYDFDVSEFAPGFYYLRLNTSLTTTNTKFIIRH